MGNANPLSALTGGGGSSSPLSGLTGGNTATSSSPIGNPFTSELGNLADTETGYGGAFSEGGYDQYLAGLTGQMTPAQQALVSENLNQMNLGTAGTYANLGLGDSTMATQDQNYNSLTSLAQQVAIDQMNEQMGLTAAGVGQGYFGQAVQALGGAGTEYNQGYQTMKSGLTNLLGGQGGSNLLSGLTGNTGAAGGGSGLLGGLLGNTGAGGTSDTQSFVDTGTFDTGVTGIPDTLGDTTLA